LEQNFNNKYTCILCGGKEFEHYLRKDSFDLIRCKGCRFIFIPQEYYSSIEMIKELYVKNKSSPVSYYLSTKELDIKYCIENLKLLERYTKPGKILDIGSNVGSFLSAARLRKWESAGVEPNPLAASYPQKEDFKIYNEFFNEDFVEKYPELYDAVHMGNVIEHVFEPVKFLQNAFKIIKPDGYLLLTTINIDTYWAKRYHIKPLEHLVYFNLETLKLTLKKSGYDVLYCIKTSRARNIGKIDKSTSKMGIMEKFIIKLTQTLGLGELSGNILKFIIVDEILIIGKKNKEAND
jgi:2-polyprenyl-3-methyl-5-hydroxy-6-metoxy-1,4-benzoquinol methylase